MQKKETAQLEPGEVFAQPVTDPKGNILIQAGVEVTPAIIRMLTNREITDVSVRPEGEENDIEDEFEDTRPTSRHNGKAEFELRELDDRLNKAFEGCMNDPLMHALFEATRSHLESKIDQKYQNN